MNIRLYYSLWSRNCSIVQKNHKKVKFHYYIFLSETEKNLIVFLNESEE